jgi:hypothetical protein
MNTLSGIKEAPVQSIRIVSRFSILIAGIAIPALSQSGYRFFNPAISDSIPKLISETGMYRSMAAKEISPDVIPFEVNTPLWTDGAFKQRYIAVPAGNSVVYNDTADAYGYPDRAMVIKNFSVDTIPGNPASRILFETRFSGVRIVAGKERWYLWTYHWRLDQTDADLVVDAGENATIRVYRNGIGNPPYLKKWRFPGKLQCAACHRVQGTGGRTVLAFFTAQLNKPLSAAPAENQLDRLFTLGILKTKDGSKPDFGKSPKWAHWDDESATLELRARSYIAANCSGCHGARGIATNAASEITLDYDFHDMKTHMDFAAKKLVGTFPLDSAGLIVPGRPDRSVLLYRQKMRNQKDQDFGAERMAMPPLGSFEPDTNAIAMMGKWITSLNPASIHGSGKGAKPSMAFRIRGNMLESKVPFTPGMEPRIALIDMRGAKIPLTRIRADLFRIDAAGLHGIHFLLADGKIAQRMAF